MTRNRSHSNGISGTVWSWIKGVLGKLQRFAMRLFRPNRGRPSSVEKFSENFHTCPLLGVKQFRYAESLTVEALMAKVQWRFPKVSPKATPNTSSSPSINSVRDQINWN
jgi:hypothetical protein